MRAFFRAAIVLLAFRWWAYPTIFGVAYVLTLTTMTLLEPAARPTVGIAWLLTLLALPAVSARLSARVLAPERSKFYSRNANLLLCGMLAAALLAARLLTLVLKP